MKQVSEFLSGQAEAGEQLLLVSWMNVFNGLQFHNHLPFDNHIGHIGAKSFINPDYPPNWRWNRRGAADHDRLVRRRDRRTPSYPKVVVGVACCFRAVGHHRRTSSSCVPGRRAWIPPPPRFSADHAPAERTPSLVVCGPIHEGRGVDRLGRTLIVNCGPAFRGCYAVASVGESVDVELLEA